MSLAATPEEEPVQRCQHVDAAAACGGVGVRKQIQSVELGSANHRTDLVAECIDIGLDLAAIDILFLGGDDLALDVGQKFGHRLGGRAGNRHRGLAKCEAVSDACKAFHVCFHRLGDGPDCGVVLGARHGLAGRDLALCGGEVRVDAFEGLQRHHGAIVRQDARHGNFVLTVMRCFAPLCDYAGTGFLNVFLTMAARASCPLRHPLWMQAQHAPRILMPA